MQAAMTAAQARGCGSSSSSARRKAQSESAMVRVCSESGRTMRVKSHRPMQVDMQRPA